MDRTQFLDTLLDRQQSRNNRGRRLTHAGERAYDLGQRRARERALLAFDLADPANGVDRFLSLSDQLNNSVAHHYDRASKLYELAARELMRT